MGVCAVVDMFLISKVRMELRDLVGIITKVRLLQCKNYEVKLFLFL